MGEKPSWFLPPTINLNFLHSRLRTFLPTASLSSASPATPQFNPRPSPSLSHAEIHHYKLYFPRSVAECLARYLRLVLPPRAQPDPALVASPAPILQRPRPRRISSVRGCAVPLFRPYVASVPWHGGVRGFLSQLFPRYGHYCGPNWSSGKDGGSMLWDQRPVDWLDFCCYCHDIGYDTYDQAKLLKADLAFLECLEQPRMASKGGGAPAAIIYRAMCIAERTYSEPRKWMRGKGRITIQFGCFYNYAVDKHGNPPGIIRGGEVDPIPPLLKFMIKRMVAWYVLPATCIPNSCILNIYDKDDCIPLHIDHHDFLRPFCTVSFLSECNIMFGTELKVLDPGEFSGSAAIPLPVGSVLILNGNGAEIAKHCVPVVPSRRISITFRKKDDSKLPFRFSLDLDLQNLRPLPTPAEAARLQQTTIHSSSSVGVVPVQQNSPAPAQAVPMQQNCGESSTPVPAARFQSVHRHQVKSEEVKLKSNNPNQFNLDDFPPLGFGSAGHSKKTTHSLRE